MYLNPNSGRNCGLTLQDLNLNQQNLGKQKQLGDTARDAVREASAFLEEKVRKKPSPHWDVLLRWASSIDSASSLRERSDSEIQRFGVGPWEDESPTCIDTAIKRPPAPPDASS